LKAESKPSDALDAALLSFVSTYKDKLQLGSFKDLLAEKPVSAVVALYREELKLILSKFQQTAAATETLQRLVGMMVEALAEPEHLIAIKSLKYLI
jgi:hypothetical protein